MNEDRWIEISKRWILMVAKKEENAEKRFFFFFWVWSPFPHWMESEIFCVWVASRAGVTDFTNGESFVLLYFGIVMFVLFVYRDGGFSVLPLVVWLYTVTSVVWWWALLMFSCPFTNRYVTYVFASYSHSINWHWECHIKIIIKLHNWKKKIKIRASIIVVLGRDMNSISR